MSLYQNQPPHHPFEAALAPFLQAEGLPFHDILPAQDIQQAFDDEAVHFGNTSRSVFTRAVTVWAVLSQVLGTNKSCRAAVLRVIVMLVALGRRPCAVDTAAYCRARAQIPATVWRRLAVQVGRRLDDAVPETWLWKTKHVHLVDGFTVTMPDTPENQQKYPQLKSQKKGIGFPIMQLVIILSLATATVQDLAMGQCGGKETGENALLRQMLGALRPGAVLLADRFYCSYFMIALLQRQGTDVVFRLHQRRHYDFRRGQHLGMDDHVVTWHRPQRPTWMDQETYDAMPMELTIREVRVKVKRPGYRIRELVIATTLTDPSSYAAAELTDLYHERWHAELDIRTLKQYLGMDTLRCLTPAMVEKEIWAHMLGYNLVRKVTAQAALLAGLSPRGLSFTAALQAVRASWDRLTTSTSSEQEVLGRSLLRGLSTETVGERPGRCEPRAVKRRPKPHPLLMQPRAEARAALMSK